MSSWHGGDDGAGPSNASPGSSDDDGDGGDYSQQFYSRLGL